MRSTATIPVIVGVGECMDRPGHPRDGLEPLELMRRAARAAERDAGAALLSQVDSLDVVPLASHCYRDPPGLLARCLDIRPRRTVYADAGADSPLRLIQDAARRIGDGQCRVALICGGDAQYTVEQARALGIELPWSAAEDAPAPLPPGRDSVHPLAARWAGDPPGTLLHAFHETASIAHWRLSPRAALHESARLWSRYARLAGGNPCAWQREPRSAEDILDVSPLNRRVAGPFTQRMTAQRQVNQGAALLLTSLETARRAGLPEPALVYPWGGAQAQEPHDLLARDPYWQSHAQNAVLDACTQLAGGAFEALELYGEFPCVPKMARRRLGLGEYFEPSVTGGLAFFGAPASNYMTHAACAMVRRLRGALSSARGLLYGHGESLVRHHGLVLARRPYPGHPALAYSSVQAIADSHRGAVPAIEIAPDGAGRLEAFSLRYRRDGRPAHGVAMVRTRSGARSLARVTADDAVTLAALADEERSPVGRTGLLQPGGNGYASWHLSA